MPEMVDASAPLSQKFRHEDFREHVTVPHPVKDIPKGTLQNIRKQAGLTVAQG